MASIKNIVFDFGGVLIDWNPVYLYSKVFDTPDKIKHFLDNICTGEWNIQQDAGRLLSEATAEKQAEFPHFKDEIAMYYGRWEEMLGGTIDTNVSLIEPLTKKYKVYGLTNWSAETIPIAMKKYDFFEKLHGIVVSGDEKLIKPDPRLYTILIERYELNPKETLFIDDNIFNIQAAKDMGFKTIHFTDDVNLENELKRLEVL